MIFYTVVKRVALKAQKAVNKMGRGEVITQNIIMFPISTSVSRREMNFA